MKKKTFLLTMILLLILSSCSDSPANSQPDTPPDPDIESPEDEESGPLTKVPFSKGFNLSGWLNLEEQWFNADAFNEKDFDELKSLGCDVVRVPVNFPLNMGAAPEYKFTSNFLKALDNAIDMAERHDMFIIIDQHSYGSEFPSDKGEAIITEGFRQLAQRYVKRSDKIVFELCNEPNGSFLQNEWPQMQRRLISAIREIDKKHIIIATAFQCNADQLIALPDYDDERLIYTFHFYDPFIFTHQGASWSESPEKYIKNVPFPYDASRMPAMPPQFKGTDREGSYIRYSTEGTENAVQEILQRTQDWATKNGNLLFCGEFGALENAPAQDRINWYKTVCDKLSQLGIAWTAWQYRGDFDIFNGSPIFELNINKDILQAMGLTIPAALEKDCPDIILYGDYRASWLTPENEQKVYFDYKDHPYGDAGSCIRWDIPNANSLITLTAWPVINLKSYVEAGAKLEFAVRTQDPIQKLTVRFQQYKDGAPWQWRNIQTITTSASVSDAVKFSNDGKWQIISIPLKDFYIYGTMGDWKEKPSGNDEGFAWDCINKIEFCADGNDAVAGKIIFFDEIAIRR